MRILLSRHSQRSFCEMLDAQGIEYVQFRPSLGMVYMTSPMIEIMGATAAMLVPIATVLVAWLKLRGSRKVQIDNTFLAEGMSKDEVIELLREAKRLTVIDTKAEELTRRRRFPTNTISAAAHR